MTIPAMNIEKLHMLEPSFWCMFSLLPNRSRCENIGAPRGRQPLKVCISFVTSQDGDTLSK